VQATPNIAVEVVLRKLPRGEIAFAASGDHLISVHASAPARMSCHGGAIRSLATRGEIFILPSGASDKCTQDDASEVVDLRLPAALVRRAAQEMGLDPETGPALECGVRDTQIEHLAWALEAERRAKSPGGRLYRECLGLALAVQLLSRHRAPRAARPPAGLPAKRLQLVVDCIEADLAGDLSLLRLARVAAVSASHFRVLFKRSMGVPVHEYVVQRRVARARALLQAGQLPPSVIALEVGFAHQSHLARCMRRVLGVTPSELVRMDSVQRRPR
jgi:AraC family transcriptional regulator